MNFLAVAGLYTLFFIFLTYVILAGGSRFHQAGVIGWLRAQLFRTCSIMKSVLLSCIPSCITNAGDKLITYLLFTRNPCIQIFYGILMAGGTSVFTIKILPHFKAFNEYGASAYILIVINLVFFITCSKKDPGVVSQENVSTFLAAYEPDGLFYTENQCYTCEIIKPARSKHCSICNVCVGRFDHHCSWVNNCIGQKNYKYFLGFIASTAVMCLYIAFIIMIVFAYIVVSQGLHISYYMDSQGNRKPASLSILTQYLLSKHTLISILFMTVLLFGVVMSGFTLFHLYLVCTNQTTNELFKRCRGLDSNQTSGTDEMKSFNSARLKTLRDRKLGKRRLRVKETARETTHISTGGSLTPYYRGIVWNIWEVFRT